MEGHVNIQDDTSLNADDETGLILCFEGSMMIIPCSDVTSVDGERTEACVKPALSTHRMLCLKNSSQHADVLADRKITPVKNNC